MPGYSPKSNREEGDGRPDIVLLPDKARNPVYLFEIKIRKKYNEMDMGLQKAFEQIRERKYEEGILWHMLLQKGLYSWKMLGNLFFPTLRGLLW